jgi:hypothetical protein
VGFEDFVEPPALVQNVFRFAERHSPAREESASFY